MAISFTISGTITAAQGAGTYTFAIDNPPMDQPTATLLGEDYDFATLFVNVTAVMGGTSPTLDLYLQETPDLNATWQDVAHTPQFTTSLSKQFGYINGPSGAAATFVAAADGTLTVNTIRQGPFFPIFRIKAVVGGSALTGSYTFKVWVTLKS